MGEGRSWNEGGGLVGGWSERWVERWGSEGGRDGIGLESGWEVYREVGEGEEELE